MEWFSYKAKFNSNNEIDLNNPEATFPDANFNSFLNGLLTVFIILTGDGWSNIYY